MDESQVTLIYHRACSECQLVKEALEKHKVAYRGRDIYAAPLSREELLVLLEGQDPKPFLNPRSSEYRDRDMARRPPSLETAVELMARDARVLRCPILVKGDQVLPVVIETDATVLPPAALQFLGIEVAPKKAPHTKPPAKGAAAGAAAPAAAKHAAEKLEGTPASPAPAEAPRT
jgi:arsenate reductase-like glutaredoxin family protein